MKRRVALKLLLFLLAGAILNVAVAWGCAVRNWRLPVLSDSLPNQPFQLWQRYAPSNWPPLGPRANEIIPGRQTKFVGYVQTQVNQSESNTKVWILCEIKAGFPLCCVSAVSAAQHTPATSVSFQDGFVVQIGSRPGLAGTPIPNQVLIPSRPIWLPFVINTIFYAAVLWVLFAAPFKLRRWRRIKRGQCASCGYSLRGTASKKCPECGALSPQRGAAV